MGSSSSVVIADFNIESFECHVLQSAHLKPNCFCRYVDDIVLVWPHGFSKLYEFVNFLNGIYENITFTIELEQWCCFPFWDALIHRRENGPLGGKVYKKPTRTNLHLNKSGHHHPVQKKAMLSTLMHRAKMFSNAPLLEEEL